MYERTRHRVVRPVHARRDMRSRAGRLMRMNAEVGRAVAVLAAGIAVLGLPAAAGAADAAAPQQLIVRFEPDASADARSAARDRAGVDYERRLLLPQTQVVAVGAGSPDAAAARLERQPGVRYAIPDAEYRALAAAPNDPLFPRQWGLRNSGQTVGGVTGVAGADVGALAAWDVTRGAGQTVAVLDTGVDLTHPDLRPNLWSNPGEVLNGVDDDGNGKVDDVNGWDFVATDADPDDFDEHGTHVAGTAVAVANNAAGGAGVAPEARIMALRVLNGNGSGGLSGILDAVAYASREGATVINLSLGAVPDARVAAAVRDLWTTALAEANARGVIVVAAAGNSSRDDDANLTYPCAAPNSNLICVAALDATGELDTSYSNYGATTVDVGAPGSGILSSVPPYTGVRESFSVAGPVPAGWTSSGGWDVRSSGLGSLGNAAFATVGPAPARATLSQSPGYDVTGRRGCRFRYVANPAVAVGDEFSAGVATTAGTLPFDSLTGFDRGGFLRFDHSLETVRGGLVGARFALAAGGAASAASRAFVDEVEIVCRTTVHTASDYAAMSGTSMASPHVAGVAALVRAAAPSASADQVAAAIRVGTVPVASLAGRTTSGGRVDALKAIEAITGRPPDPPPTVPFTPAPPVVPGAPMTPAVPVAPVVKSACAGRRGTALTRCRLDQTVKTKCAMLRGRMHAVCAKKVRALAACRALPARTRRQRARRAQCLKKAHAIGRPQPRARARR